MITTMGWPKCILFVFMAIPFFTFSQNNLVPNPSFELYTSCPIGVNQLSLAFPWLNPNFGSPDFCHSCSTPSTVGVPSNNLGFQLPNNGSGYSGIAIVIPENAFPNSGREYIETQLLYPLTANLEYCVLFYVSLANESRFATDQINAYFSDTIIDTQNINNIYLTPQITNSNGIISDTTNWIEISGTFIANGGEKYLTIGNFALPFSYQVDTVNPSFNFSYAYYYIDDVSVYLCDSSVINADSIIIPNVFSPNDDGINDLFLLENLPQGYEVIIYNRWGEIMQQFSHQSTTTKNTWYWDGYTQAGLACPEGVYFYILKLPGREDRKGTVTLVR